MRPDDTRTSQTVRYHQRLARLEGTTERARDSALPVGRYGEHRATRPMGTGRPPADRLQLRCFSSSAFDLDSSVPEQPNIAHLDRFGISRQQRASLKHPGADGAPRNPAGSPLRCDRSGARRALRPRLPRPTGALRAEGRNRMSIVRDLLGQLQTGPQPSQMMTF